MKNKRISETGAPNIYLVDSEPGDATRYNYFVFRNGPDIFHFMPCDNTFKYPQILNYWDIRDIQIDGSKSIEVCEEWFRLAHKHMCNPHTLAECIRTAKKMFNE